MTDLVARVVVESPLPHLDRRFDFSIPPELADEALPGCRVRVRFHGRRVTGWLLEVGEAEYEGRLSPLLKVLGPPVLTEEVGHLARGVADRWAGTLSDVLRFAVPPRVAAVEKSPRSAATGLPTAPDLSAWDEYVGFGRIRSALGEGRGDAAAWICHPDDDPFDLLARLCVSSAAAGRAAVAVLPDGRDVAAFTDRLGGLVDPRLVAVLTGDLSARVRYRTHLDIQAGAKPVVVGTRSAVFAPLTDPGLVVVWDDGDAVLAEPHAPGWHAREVAALRGWRSSTVLVVGGYTRTAQTQSWVESGWAVDLKVSRSTARRHRYVIDAVHEPGRDTQRIPRQAFTVVRDGLAHGPVLVQVPRRGGSAAVLCAQCSAVQRCATCGGGISRTDGRLACRTCGAEPSGVCGSCGGDRLVGLGAGSARSAEQLRRAFPDVSVLRSDAAGGILDGVGPDPAIVVATPGSEPDCAGGYGAVLILDPEVLLSLLSLRAPEESARRWMRAIALAAPGAASFIAGAADNYVVQALIRNDPGGLAARELTDRRQAGMPPATRVVRLRGTPAALDEWLAEMPAAADVLVLGPLTERGRAQALLVAAAVRGGQLAAMVRQVQATRSLAGREPVEVRVDPVDLGEL